MQFELENLNNRSKNFIDYFVANTSSDSDRGHPFLQSMCKIFNDPEERLFFIFLSTHFDSPYVANEFYQKLNWNKIQQIDEIDIYRICKDYISEQKFTGERLIGDHRRYFRCLPKGRKVDYSAEILVSYRRVIREYDSQTTFFEVGNDKSEFDVLYQRMAQIAHFHPRLPRFDHLERLSRLNNFYVTPDRFYTEDSTGPLYGLTYLLFGKRLGKDSGIAKKSLVKSFPQIWNEQVGGKYVISNGADFKQIISLLELWIVDRVRNDEMLSLERQSNKGFIFDVESCLCNWQKRKC